MRLCKTRSGKRFGKLVVVKRAETKTGKGKWICKCDCGNEKTILGVNLASGSTKSCGCLRIEMQKLNRHEKSQKAKYNKLQAELGDNQNLTWDESSALIDSVVNSTLGSLLEQ